MSSSSRSYSDRTLKVLWGRAAGRCAVPTCRIELFVDATEHDPIVAIGDIAHIEASSDAGPRANSKLAKRERDEYDNLILLCLICHRRLDGQKNSNSVENIKKLRSDHESWVRNSLPERGKSTIGWIMMLLQGAQPFDLESTISALTPDFPAGDPVILKVDSGKESWAGIQQKIANEVTTLFSTGDPFNIRIAVFPLAPVSACIALGYYLTDRPRVRLFKYYADDHSWDWPNDTSYNKEFKVSGLPENVVTTSGDIALCFHLSATITEEAICDVGHSFLGKIHIVVSSPSTSWLRRPEQIRELSMVARQVYEACQARFPNAEEWHLFFAGPAPGGVIIGQQLNPTMCPPIQMYEYQRGRKPAYQPSFTLGEGS